MPTGYTATLMEEGQSFRDFALLCTRAMGATIMMRDEPLSTPIPRFEPSPYYAKQIETSNRSLRELEAMDVDQQSEYGRTEQKSQIESLEKSLARVRDQNARLLDMEQKVAGWVPPTKEHVGLKHFMLQQIETSKDDEQYYLSNLDSAKEVAPVKVYADAVAAAKSQIEYYKKQQEREVKQTAERNAWVDALRGSLQTYNP